MTEMDHFGIPLENELWQDFIDLKNQPETFRNHKSYFNTLVSWVKKHQSHIESIHHTLLVSNRIETILETDIDEYLSKNPEVLLDMEVKRMFSRHPETINSLLMGIGTTLWDLVRFETEENCPNCIYDGLSYVRVEVKDTKEIKIVSECETCGYAENLDGSRYADGCANGYPVNDDDFVKYGAFAGDKMNE